MGETGGYDGLTVENVPGLLEEQGLDGYNWFQDRTPQIDEVGVLAAPNGWRVYESDERATIYRQELFTDEQEALEYFVERVRLVDRTVVSPHAPWQKDRVLREMLAGEVTREQALGVLRGRGLHHYNWLEDRPARPEEVGLVPDGDGWRYYRADWRGRVEWERSFPIQREHGAYRVFLGGVLSNCFWLESRGRRRRGLPIYG